MMEYSVNNILMQAGTSMLTQANQSSQSILELLQ
jgi:flagellin